MSSLTITLDGHGIWVLHANDGEMHLIQGTQFWYPFLNLSSIQ